MAFPQAPETYLITNHCREKNVFMYTYIYISIVLLLLLFLVLFGLCMYVLCVLVE